MLRLFLAVSIKVLEAGALISKTASIPPMLQENREGSRWNMVRHRPPYMYLTMSHASIVIQKAGLFLTVLFDGHCKKKPQHSLWQWRIYCQPEGRPVLPSCSLTVAYLLLARGQACLTVMLSDSGVSTVSQRAGLSWAETCDVVFIAAEGLAPGPGRRNTEGGTCKYCNATIFCMWETFALLPISGYLKYFVICDLWLHIFSNYRRCTTAFALIHFMSGHCAHYMTSQWEGHCNLKSYGSLVPGLYRFLLHEGRQGVWYLFTC